MLNAYDVAPSSLRSSGTTVESSRFVQNLVSRAHRPALMAAGSVRAAVLAKSRFARLPQEPEDARMTGVTRSLQRRLLALNLPGTLVRHDLVVESKIA